MTTDEAITTQPELFHASFACPACAREAERALRANPHVERAEVDYRQHLARVSYRQGAIERRAIEELISRSAFGCSCTAMDQTSSGVGGDLAALAHHADMAAVTMGTTTDRMQYEFAATSAGRLHKERAAIDGRAPAAHGGMAHDMSDPVMAKAMEADMRNRFLVALVLTIPTLLFSPLAMNTLGLHLVPLALANWLMLLLTTPVVWWAGWVFIAGAVISLRDRALNMSVLIATGILAAWGFSLGITLSGQGETFYEAAAMLVTFVLFGHWVEMRSRRGTTDALRALFDLVPPTATVIRNGQEETVPTNAIEVGDRVRLRPGEKVPVDGVIREGATSIDQSLVTGESVPVDKEPGDAVVGGSINRQGSVVMEATKVGSETVLAQIVALASEHKARRRPASGWRTPQPGTWSWWQLGQALSHSAPGSCSEERARLWP